MAHGLPDYGINVAKQITYNLADLADLAVRLGSIVEYDRRGDVIFLDDYESPLRRYREVASADCSARLDSTSSRSGAQCCYLRTNGVIDTSAGAQYYLAPMVLGRHGIKISAVLLDLHTSSSLFLIWFSIRSATHLCEGGITFNPWARTITYRDQDGNDPVFEPNFRPISANVWAYHNIKLVVDLDTGYYVRLLVDTLEWDMSTRRFTKTPGVFAPDHLVVFDLEDLAGIVKQTYIDDFVYTLNEP